MTLEQVTMSQASGTDSDPADAATDNVEHVVEDVKPVLEAKHVVDVKHAVDVKQVHVMEPVDQVDHVEPSPPAPSPDMTPALPDIEKLYECDECGQRFTREYYVQRHKLAVHTEDKPFKCTQCDRTFSQGQGLARHMISHTGEKKFICERCNKTFGFKSNLDRHKRNICYKNELHNPTIQIPGVERRYKCDVCDKSFSLKSNFERHKRTVCFKDRIRNPIVVTRSPGSGGQHKCDVCQKVFGTPFNLQRHQKAVCYKNEFQSLQNNDISPLFSVKEELKFAADQDYNQESTHAQFTTQDYQQQYDAISSAIKDEFGDLAEDYGNDSVDFTSPEYKTELENEMSQIESAGSDKMDTSSPVPFKTVVGADGKERKIYTCDKCNRTFGFRHNLDRHIRTNVCGLRPSSATDELSVALIQPNPLTELQQKVYTEAVNSDGNDIGVRTILVQQPPAPTKPMILSPALKPHKCPKCENRFGTYQALNAHVKIHNKVNPYTCNVCDRIFVGKKELIRHKKLHTDGEVDGADKAQKHECSVCGLFFSSEQELANHFVLHVEEKPFACETCRSSFGTINELVVHRKIHDEQPASVVVQQPINPTFANTGANKIVLYTTAGSGKPLFVQYSPQEDLNASRDSGLGDTTEQAPVQAPGQVMTILSVVEKNNTFIQPECPSLDEIMENMNTIDQQQGPITQPEDMLVPPVHIKDEVDGDPEPEKMCVGYQIENYTSEPRDSPMTVTSSATSCDSPAPDDPHDKVTTLPGFIELQPMPFPGQGSILYQCSFCQENFINSDNLMMHVKIGHLNGENGESGQSQNFTQHALMAASL